LIILCLFFHQDPHFVTWYGNHFSYHGACDLKFLHNKRFGNGLGLDLDIRTQHMMNQAYSFISNAVLRIGEDILEVVADGRHFINSQLDLPLPALLGGYFVSKSVNESCRGRDENRKCWYSMQFNIAIGLDDYIRIKVASEMIHVTVEGKSDTFAGSVGLVGTYPGDHHGKIARDGVTFIRDPDTYAEEWQVLDTEPKLFQGLRRPQHPEKCIPAIKPGLKNGRRLRNLSEAEAHVAAEEACSHVKGPEWEFCMFDVSATGDYGMAATVYG